MPKRMLDDSLLTSASLARCSPRCQDAFPRFILLADDFGCFEVIPRALAARGWVYRQDVTEANVVAWLEEYVGAGMACLWTQNERRYCYLTGWDGEHGQRKRAEYNPNAPKGTPGAHGSKRRTPAPPADLVAAVRAGIRRDRDGKPPGTDHFPPGNAAETNFNDFTPAREIAGSAREIRGSAAPVPVPVPVAVPDPGTTHTLARVREAGAADRAAIDAYRDAPPHPLMDQVVLALRAAGLAPQYPKNGMRASVEAAIAQATVPVSVERIRAAWHVSKPWLTQYLEAIVPPPPEVKRRAVVLPPADGWEPAPGPPPDESVPLFPDVP